MSYCVTRTYLKDFTTWFPLSRIDFWEYESTRIESIRQNFSPPCAFIRDLTSGKSSSAKRTSGESEVFDPRADSNRLCFKTIRLSLGVLDMSDKRRSSIVLVSHEKDRDLFRELGLESAR